MEQQLELESKRREVREEILALKEHIPTALIFNQLGRIFKHNSFGYWLSVIFLLNLIVIVPTLLVGLIFKEIEKLFFVFMYGLGFAEKLLFGFANWLMRNNRIIPARQNAMWLEINERFLFCGNMFASFIFCFIQESLTA